MKKTHAVKILPEYMTAVEDGLKTFEIRKNDRDYKVGDYVLLQEWDGKGYTGWQVIVEITYITDYEQKPGYVVFSFTKENIASRASETIKG